jgi:hypothetical protein
MFDDAWYHTFSFLTINQLIPIFQTNYKIQLLVGHYVRTVGFSNRSLKNAINKNNIRVIQFIIFNGVMPVVTEDVILHILRVVRNDIFVLLYPWLNIEEMSLPGREVMYEQLVSYGTLKMWDMVVSLDTKSADYIRCNIIKRFCREVVGFNEYLMFRKIMQTIFLSLENSIAIVDAKTQIHEIAKRFDDDWMMKKLNTLVEIYTQRQLKNVKQTYSVTAEPDYIDFSFLVDVETKISGIKKQNKMKTMFIDK